MKKISLIEKIEPFKKTNKLFFKNHINYLTKYHYLKSRNYKKILDMFNYNKNKNYDLENLPFITANLFKDLELRSIKKKELDLN